MKRELTLLVDGVPVTVTAERRGDRIVVELDGQVHEVVVTGDRALVPGAGPVDSPAASPAEPPVATEASAAAMSAPPTGAPGDVRAPMVGVVREIHATQGAAVTAGDLIITMEAMKMDIYVNAPLTGTVAAVHCTVGETAGEGAVLATVRPSGSGADT